MVGWGGGSWGLNLTAVVASRVRWLAARTVQGGSKGGRGEHTLTCVVPGVSTSERAGVLPKLCSMALS